MTLLELKNEIAALGFESEVTDDKSFVFAVKRAIATIYTERGIHKTLRIYQRNPMPDFYLGTLVHGENEYNTFRFVGGAYFFRVFGEGKLSVKDDSGYREIDFNSPKEPVRGLINGVGEITFSGNLRYTVYDLCHFSELYSPNPDDLNFATHTEYRIEKIADDYLGPQDRPRDKNGNIIEGASVCSGTLLVPYGYSGEVQLKYRCKPYLSPDAEPDTELPIDSESEHLIPLLAAAYIWLDDDAEKAQYYMSLYRDGMASLKLYSPRCVSTEYEDVTGWAK